MSQTKDRPALDEFAKTPVSKGELVPIAPTTALAERHGAIAVEVKRDLAEVYQELRVGAAEAGDDWFYRWTVRNRRKGSSDYVEGLSIKGANALIMAYGNCKVDCAVIDKGSEWEFVGRFIDYQRGTELQRPFRQRKNAGTMGEDAERQRDAAYAMGVSKAERNAVVNALQSLADFALREAKNALVDKIGNDIERYRREVTGRVSRHVDLARVEAVVGRPAKDWIVTDIARVIALASAVTDGMATWDETFPPLKSSTPPDEAAKASLDKFASTSASAHVEGDAAGATDAPSSAPAAPDERELLKSNRQRAVDQLMRAARTGIDAEERVANIDVIGAMIEDELEGDEAFLKPLFATAVKVARDELPVEAARKYLGGLK